MMTNAENVLLTNDDESIGNERQDRWSRKLYYRLSILHPKEEQPHQEPKSQQQQEEAPQQKSKLQPQKHNNQQDPVLRVAELVEQLQKTQREEREHTLQVRREERQYIQRMREEELQRSKMMRLENQQQIQRIHKLLQPMQQKIQQIEPMQQLVRYIEPMRKQIAELEQMMAAFSREKPASVPFRNLRPVNVLCPVNDHRAVRAENRAPVGAQVPHLEPRRSPRYTEDEDRRMVRYLVQNRKIDRARSDHVWEEMRAEDPVIALRSVQSLKHRFRVYVWPWVMAGKYTDNLQTLRKFGGIWPERVVRAP